MGRARRSGDRDQPHAQPADCTGVHGIARDLAAADMGTFKDPPIEAGEGRVPLPGCGQARFRRDAVALPRLCAAPGARRQERPVAGMAAEAAHSDRPASDQCAGRHHQLHDLRPRPAAARVRRRQGARRSRGAPREGGERAARARRQDLRARRDDVRDRRRRRASNRSPASWAARPPAARRRPPTC